MTATVPSLRMLLEEAAQQAYDQGGRWEKQCACRKMIGLRLIVQVGLMGRPLQGHGT